VTFSSGGKFEGGRVQTGGRGPSGGLAVGGGLGGLVLVALFILLQGGSASDVIQAVSVDRQQVAVGSIGACTAEEANTSRDCRLSATVQALDAYWEPLVNNRGAVFVMPQVVSFSGATGTACGNATSAVGPFYCPADETIYIDLSFYDLLSSEFGTQDGPLAEEYITAHEYGHHIQNLLGTMNQVGQDTGATSGSVRLELQADCYAGMWAGQAATTVDPDTGVTFLDPITADQLANAQAAAQGVGDDRIQQNAGVSVNPDTWTHGSAQQRRDWFMVGYQIGTLAACDTFTATNL
jgi:predicted metalloprotease